MNWDSDNRDLWRRAWPPFFIRSNALRATAFTLTVLFFSWYFGNAAQRKVAVFILATPIVLFLSLVTLAASNVAFSILYTRRQLRPPSSSSARKSVHDDKRSTPGQSARHLFSSLRPALFTRPTAWMSIERKRRQEQAAKYRVPIADTMPQLAEAMDSLIELIMRDYVTGWMRAITPEVVLQQRIEELLRIVLIRLKTRVMDLDLTHLLVTRLVPKVTAHVNDFRKAEMTLRGNSLERSLTESDELDIVVASKFRDGRLHKALSTSISTAATEEAYLRIVVQTVLPTLLPKSEVQSEILRHLLRELLVGAVLRPVMDLLSDPDYWNQNVDLYTGKAIREQNMVKKLREALQQHTDGLDVDSRIIENPTNPYGTGADLYSFEDFLKMIKRCDSLLDVKRIRNTIMTQMRKKKALIVNREKDDIVNGNKVEDIIVYINRLDIAKRRAEKRIEALGGPAYPKRRTRDYTPEAKNIPALVPLDAILSNPSGLSYFMEFQDRRDNMNELQFWLLVDTLNIVVDQTAIGAIQQRSDSDVEKHPDPSGATAGLDKSATPASILSKDQVSEPLTSSTPVILLRDSAEQRQSYLGNSIRDSRKASVATTMTFEIADTLREDVKMIYDTYFADSAPRPIVVDLGLVQTFREFSVSDGGSRGSSIKSSRTLAHHNQIRDSTAQEDEDKAANRVRRRLLLAQEQIFEQMQAKDYPEFVRSDLYFKFLASYHNPITEQGTEGTVETEDSPPLERVDRHHVRSKSSSQTRPALFSAIGLGSPERRRAQAPEQPKRSSTGSSFLDIFGLGRDKEKERERDREKDLQYGKPKLTETSLQPTVTLGGMRPGFLTPNSGSRSKPGSPGSSKTSNSGTLAQREPSATPHGLDIPSRSSTRLARSRSMSSVSNPEAFVAADQAQKLRVESNHRQASSGLNRHEGEFFDWTESEGQLKTSLLSSHRESAGLGDSLLEELREHVDQDDEAGLLLEDSHEALTLMPRIQSHKSGKERVIDAVEAALSSIMENQDAQQDEPISSAPNQEDHALEDSRVNYPSIDPTDPAFSTARNTHTEPSSLLAWGKAKRNAERRGDRKETPSSGSTTLSKVGESHDQGKSLVIGVVGHERSPKSSTATIDTLHRESDASSDDSHDEWETRSDRDGAVSATGAVQENVHLAAPGDLLLATRIKKLEQEIEMFKKQESIVETMIQKAERQGRQNELRILKKSKSALRREILGMEYQKTQYEVQEEENMILPGRSTISITSSTVGHDGSKEFALYVIEVHQLAQDGSFASGWVIARRYSEFFSLHQQLKEKFNAIVRNYELPGKRGFLKLQKSFVESRRIALERYLQALVQYIEICQSQELRAFLSQENVALPQFSVASSPISSSSFLPYNLFDVDSFGKDGGGGSAVGNDIGQSRSEGSLASPQPVQNQHFFEQLFHSSTALPVTTENGGGPNAGAGTPLVTTDGSKVTVHGQDVRNYKTSGETLVDPNEGFMKHIYQTVSEGLDDMFSGGPPTVLGNITKQLGNQVMQFTMEDEEGMVRPNLGTREGHSSTGDDGVVRPRQNEYRTFDPITDTSSNLQPAQQSSVQRSKSRRLSSPDPHTQHQRLQLQNQPQQQQQQQQRQQHILSQQQQQIQTRPAVVEPEGVTTFTEPLCDLFIELFELKEKNNWLRRQAVVIILQQVLGGTIERKLRDTIKAYLEESMLTFYVLKLKDSLWPTMNGSLNLYGSQAEQGNQQDGLHGSSYLSEGYEVIGEDGKLAFTALGNHDKPQTPLTVDETTTTPPVPRGRPSAQRTLEQKALTKDQANRKLSAFLPELLGNMVGHQNARRGARRVFAAFQNRRLNQQLVYTALDEVVGALWPDLAIISHTEGATPTCSPSFASMTAAAVASDASSATKADDGDQDASTSTLSSEKINFSKGTRLSSPLSPVKSINNAGETSRSHLGPSRSTSTTSKAIHSKDFV
ncbi:Intermediate filament protein [Gryganskiella cystojenkinii]|nr:Intermediate filament protein [Gryganskiella cystojenkinii]